MMGEEGGHLAPQSLVWNFSEIVLTRPRGAFYTRVIASARPHFCDPATRADRRGTPPLPSQKKMYPPPIV
jgi:hypothetical protein